MSGLSARQQKVSAPFQARLVVQIEARCPEDGNDRGRFGIRQRTGGLCVEFLRQLADAMSGAVVGQGAVQRQDLVLRQVQRHQKIPHDDAHMPGKRVLVTWRPQARQQQAGDGGGWRIGGAMRRSDVAADRRRWIAIFWRSAVQNRSNFQLARLKCQDVLGGDRGD